MTTVEGTCWFGILCVAGGHNIVWAIGASAHAAYFRPLKSKSHWVISQLPCFVRWVLLSCVRVVRWELCHKTALILKREWLVQCSSTSIHPSSKTRLVLLSGSQGLPEPLPGVMGWKQGYTIKQRPIDTHTTSYIVELPSDLACMFLDPVGGQRTQREARTVNIQTAQIKAPRSETEPTALLLSDDNAKHCITVSNLLIILQIWESKTSSVV